MSIKIIALGKSKQSFISDGIAEFQKRLKPFHKVQLEILPDVKLTSSNSIEIVKSKEAEIILKKLSPRDYVIALDEKGKQFSSVDFSSFMIKQLGLSNLVFVIGGVYGLSSNVLNRANYTLSFSRMTFTHQMIRFILLEQIYRAFTIIRGKKYHY